MYIPLWAVRAFKYCGENKVAIFIYQAIDIFAGLIFLGFFSVLLFVIFCLGNVSKMLLPKLGRSAEDSTNG